MIGAALLTGNPSFKDYAKSIRPTDTPPVTRFEYQSINTQVLGLLLEKVTGKRLNEYAQEKLWKKIGAQSDAFFYTSNPARHVVIVQTSAWPEPVSFLPSQEQGALLKKVAGDIAPY
ncbi:MAG: serine hydrolase [Acidobacteria bacterium]|nr:serine hydrolase [Acidobacteriota bacterium]